MDVFPFNIEIKKIVLKMNAGMPPIMPPGMMPPGMRPQMPPGGPGAPMRMPPGMTGMRPPMMGPPPQLSQGAPADD